MNTLLSKLRAPLLLLWGDKDPWIVPSRVSSGWACVSLSLSHSLCANACKYLVEGSMTQVNGLLTHVWMALAGSHVASQGQDPKAVLRLQ